MDKLYVIESNAIATFLDDNIGSIYYLSIIGLFVASNDDIMMGDHGRVVVIGPKIETRFPYEKARDICPHSWFMKRAKKSFNFFRKIPDYRINYG